MLIQGTNTPVVIEFDEDTADMKDISVALVCNDEIKKDGQRMKSTWKVNLHIVHLIKKAQ